MYLNKNTRVMLYTFASIVSILVLFGGFHLVRLEVKDTTTLLCGIYMMIDGLLVFIVATARNFATVWDKVEDEQDNENDFND